MSAVSDMSDLELLVLIEDEWLVAHEDEGPYGEGWQSDALAAVRTEIERRRRQSTTTCAIPVALLRDLRDADWDSTIGSEFDEAVQALIDLIPDDGPGPCAGCDHVPACGFASVTMGGQTHWLCHDDDHSCYTPNSQVGV